MRKLWILLAIAVTPPLEAQLTARAAYDTVQRLRAEADSLLAAGRPGAMATLERALRFLERPEVADLAQGWPYLRARTPNVWWDMAVVATLEGDSLAALEALERVRWTGGSSVYREWLRTDSVLSRWASHPRVRAIDAALRQQQRLYGDSAFVSEYRDTLPRSERVAGLSLVWAEVRYAYPDFAERPEHDWDARYQHYLERVLEPMDSYEYFRTLQRFVAELGDGHTNVYFPRPLQRRFARPPIRTGLVEGKVLVTSIRSPTVRALGLRVGDEIVTIDGEPVRRYAAREVAPFQSSATEQDLALRTYSYQLLLGPADQAVGLGVVRADGSRRTIELARTGYDDVEPGPAPVVDSLLPGNVGYLRIGTFGIDSVRHWARAALERLRGARALIIDIRENGGGNTTLAPLAVLARRPIPAPGQRIRNYSALDRARGFEPQPTHLRASDTPPDPTLRFDGPVALLIGPATFSAAEDFAVAFDEMERGTIVGEPSGGNTGQPLSFVLPGGGFGRVRTKHDSYGDGREFLFRGVTPQLVVRPTVAGVRAGRDEVLEAAIRVVGAH
ncbi:MAG: S41 family peptidase [Gemmatimonadales bacterium]